jgi:hypothetical protein
LSVKTKLSVFGSYPQKALFRLGQTPDGKVFEPIGLAELPEQEVLSRKAGATSP